MILLRVQFSIKKLYLFKVLLKFNPLFMILIFVLYILVLFHLKTKQMFTPTYLTVNKHLKFKFSLNVIQVYFEKSIFIYVLSDFWPIFYHQKYFIISFSTLLTNLLRISLYGDFRNNEFFSLFWKMRKYDYRKKAQLWNMVFTHCFDSDCCSSVNRSVLKGFR